MDQLPARKRLQEMTPQELVGWLAGHQGELEDFASYTQGYIKRRSRQGKHTLTDERYERFLVQAADLLAGLDEMRQAAEQAAQEERNA